MQNKIQHLFLPEKITLSGIIEIDEAFVGKGKQWSRWGSISTRKAPVIGLIERGGRVVIKAIPDRTRNTILAIIEEYVEAGSTIYTDGWKGYNRLPKKYKHDFVVHSDRQYADGDVHTNNIENVWGYFKKSIRNAHHHISDKHVQLYLDEASWKFNNRHLSTKERFLMLVTKSMESVKKSTICATN